MQIYYQNVRGMRTKLRDLLLSVSDCDYDVIVFSETWLNQDIHDSELGMDGYNIYRKDRSELTSLKCWGGGVMIAVRGCYQSFLIINEQESVEHIFVSVCSGSEKMIVGAVYLPQPLSVDTVQAHCSAIDSLLQRYPKHDLCLLGDYNLPNVNWINDDLGVRASRDNREVVKLLSDCFAYNQLFQVNSISNSNNVMLDLVFVHDKLVNVNIANECLLPCDQHHPALTIEVPRSSRNSDLQYDTYSYNFKAADYAMLNDFFKRVSQQMKFYGSINVPEVYLFWPLFYFTAAFLLYSRFCKQSHYEGSLLDTFNLLI